MSRKILVSMSGVLAALGQTPRFARSDASEGRVSQDIARPDGRAEGKTS